MSMTLDGLLRAIHPEVTIVRFEREANAAVLRTRPLQRIPRDPRSLLLDLAAMQHRMSRPQGDRTPFPAVDFDRHARVVNHRLRQHFGERGIGVAFQIVQGDGSLGFRQVMDILINRHATDRTNLVVRKRVNRFWMEQDATGRIVAAQRYLQRFAPLLPPDQRQRDSVRLATVLPGVLRQHPFRLRDLLGLQRLRR